MAKKKLPKVISKEDLSLKSTRELLGYLNRLRQCEETFESSDRDKNIDLVDHEQIYFKQTDKWKLAYKNVKAILDTRENIDKKRKPKTK